MLTISDLAQLVGTTSRAIRHYHQLGIMPEPVRRANGYRSYGPADLIRLTRIRRLQDIGLGLTEIGRLLAGTAEHDDTREALESLDEELAHQQQEITRRRQHIASVLAGPGDVTLPPELAEILEKVTALGVDPAHIAAERDAIALVVAVHPEHVPQLATLYRGLLDQGEEVVTLSNQFAALAGADPDDPAVAEVAQLVVAVLGRLGISADTDHIGRYEIFQAYLTEALSPAQHRCAQLIGAAFHEEN
jgi:DNA-binding transcriptional MerR regulator